MSRTAKRPPDLIGKYPQVPVHPLRSPQVHIFAAAMASRLVKSAIGMLNAIYHTYYAILLQLLTRS